jgi:hypothetical protein
MNNSQSRGPFLFPDPCSLFPEKAYPTPLYDIYFQPCFLADNLNNCENQGFFQQHTETTVPEYEVLEKRLNSAVQIITEVHRYLSCAATVFRLRHPTKIAATPQ